MGLRTSNTGRKSRQTTPAPYVRRIPRGKTGRVDSLKALQRMAERARADIRKMRRLVPSKAKVRGKRARDLLAKEHQRLIDLLEVIASRPSDVTTGTYDVIEDAKNEAVRIYATAGKQRTQKGITTPKRLRRKVRRQGKVRPEDTSEPVVQAMIQADEDMVTEAMLKDRARHAPEIAEYQAILDQETTNSGS